MTTKNKLAQTIDTPFPRQGRMVIVVIPALCHTFLNTPQ